MDTYTPVSQLNFPELRGVTVPTATASPTSPASTEIGDLVFVIHMTRHTTNIVLTIQSGFTDHHNFPTSGAGASSFANGIAYKVASLAGAQTYTAYSASAGSSYAGIIVIKAGTFRTSNPLDSSTGGGGLGATPPPALSLEPTKDRSFAIILAQWALSAPSSITYGFPDNVQRIYEMSGSQSVGMAAAGVLLNANLCDDDNDLDVDAWTDDVVPVGATSRYIMINRPYAPQGGAADIDIWEDGIGPVPVISIGDNREESIIQPPYKRCSDRDQWVYEKTPRGFAMSDSGSPFFDYPVTSYGNTDLVESVDGYLDVTGCNSGDLILVTVAFTFEWTTTAPGDWTAYVYALDDVDLEWPYALTEFLPVVGSKWWNAHGSSPSRVNTELVGVVQRYSVTVVHPVLAKGTTRLTYGYTQADSGGGTDRFKIYEFGMTAQRFPY
jgi:hypothetical protein